MKNFKIISSFIFMACIVFTGCEKDSALAPTGTKNQPVKNKSINNKSGEDMEYWVNLQSFAYFITTGEDDSIPDMEAEKAILYTESVLDYTLVNNNVSMIKHEVGNLSVEFSYPLTETAEGLIIDNYRIVDMYNNLKSEIIDGITRTSYDSDVIVAISMIDVEYEINELSMQAEVTVKVIYAQNKSIPIAITCSTPFNQDLQAGVDKYCNGLGSGFDARDYINAYLDLACNFNNQITCYEPDFLSVNLSTVKYIAETSCNDYTFAGPITSCILGPDAYTIFDNIRTSWNQNCNNISQNGHLNKIDIIAPWGLGPNTRYDVHYQNATCVQICPNPCLAPIGNPDCYDKYGQPKACAA